MLYHIHMIYIYTRYIMISIFEPVHFDQVVGTCSCIKAKHLKVQMLEYGMLHLGTPLSLCFRSLLLKKLSIIPVQLLHFWSQNHRKSIEILSDSVM